MSTVEVNNFSPQGPVISGQPEIFNITVAQDNNQIIVPHPVTNVVEINNQGPQGPTGPQGPQGPSGSNDVQSVISSSAGAYVSASDVNVVVSASQVSIEADALVMRTGSNFIVENITENIPDGGIIYSTSEIGNGHQFYGTLNAINGLTGSLQGTADNAIQLASGSITASVTPTQFLIRSGSNTEFQVTGTGVTIGSTLTDVHRVTGSLSITGSFNPSVIQNAAPASIGATTAFTGLATLTVPGGTLSVGDSLEVVSYCSFANSGSPGNRTVRIWFGSVNGLTVATTAALTSSILSNVTRVVGKVISSTSIVFNPVSTASAATTLTGIDITQTNSFFFGGQKSVSGDTFTQQHASVIIQKL